MKDLNIHVIGEQKAFKVFLSLKKKYKNKLFFHKESEVYRSNLTLFKAPSIFIIEESSESMKIITLLENIIGCHIIYLSNRKGFGHIFSLIKKGVNDYIFKDSYLYYSVHQSITKLRKREIKKDVFLDSCNLKTLHPVKYKLLNLVYPFVSYSHNQSHLQ